MNIRHRALRGFVALAIPCLISAIFGLPTCFATKPLPNQTIKGADNAELSVALSDADVTITYQAPGLSRPDNRIFLALGTHQDIGAAVLPFQQEFYLTGRG